jgi:hypothetical protein
LGDNPKVFYNDWVNNKSFKTYSLKRDKKIEYSNSKIEISENEEHLNQKPNFNNATHNNQRVSSIIDVSLWDSAKWKGFGFFGDAQGMGIFLAFENGEVGNQIFDNWIKTFGIEDKNGDIRLAIIKGINKEKPHWYNVHVSKELEGRAKESGDFFISASRYNEITPENPTNLNNLIMGWEMFKKYRLVPAQLLEGGKVEPFFDKAILKTSLVIKNAWEISENDLDLVVIKPTSDPIIPPGVRNAPVLKVLQNKKNN